MKQTCRSLMIVTVSLVCIATGQVWGNDSGGMRWVAASSAAWGWFFPTIPKAFGFEAATQSQNREHVDSSWDH